MRWENWQNLRTTIGTQVKQVIKISLNKLLYDEILFKLALSKIQYTFIRSISNLIHACKVI